MEGPRYKTTIMFSFTLLNILTLWTAREATCLRLVDDAAYCPEGTETINDMTASGFGLFGLLVPNFIADLLFLLLFMLSFVTPLLHVFTTRPLSRLCQRADQATEEAPLDFTERIEELNNKISDENQFETLKIEVQELATSFNSHVEGYKCCIDLSDFTYRKAFVLLNQELTSGPNFFSEQTLRNLINTSSGFSIKHPLTKENCAHFKQQTDNLNTAHDIYKKDETYVQALDRLQKMFNDMNTAQHGIKTRFSLTGSISPRR